MRLRLAGSEDEQKLKQFYHQFILTGPVELKIERPQLFSSPYSVQSPKYCTYILEDSESLEILGCVSFVIVEVLLGDRKQTIAWGRDLRISTHRQAVLGWSEHFLPVIQELKEKFHVQYLFSSLNMSETKVLNAFIRPRLLRRPLPRYHMYRKFNIITVHGRWPWAHRPWPALSVKPLPHGREDELMYYILQKSLSLDLLPWFDRKSIMDQIERWPDLRLNDFLIATDSEENIVGCVAPWRSHHVQNYIPYGYDLRAHNFRQFLKFGKLWGWTRPLTKPVSRLKQEAAMRMTYLNYLHVDHPDVFEALLAAAYEMSGPDDFLVYLQMREQFHLKPPENWISAQRPHGLYCILPPDASPPAFLDPSNDRSICMEPFFV